MPPAGSTRGKRQNFATGHWEAHGKQRGKKIPASRAARQVSELIARAKPGSPLGQTAGSTGPQSQKKKAAPQSGQELREVPSHAVRQHA